MFPAARPCTAGLKKKNWFWLSQSTGLDPGPHVGHPVLHIHIMEMINQLSVAVETAEK